MVLPLLDHSRNLVLPYPFCLIIPAVQVIFCVLLYYPRNLISISTFCLITPAGGTGGKCTKYETCDSFGPWNGFCCPNGFTCQPDVSNFQIWRCQTDVTDQAAVNVSMELLQYPPRPLPADACACRQNYDRQTIPMACPSPWDTSAGYKEVGVWGCGVLGN